MVDDTETQTPFDSPDSQIDEVVDATRDVPSRLHAAHIGRAMNIIDKILHKSKFCFCHCRFR